MGPREEVEELDRILCRVCMRPSPQLAYCRPSEDYRGPGAAEWYSEFFGWSLGHES
jgi:hypothetical protein